MNTTSASVSNDAVSVVGLPLHQQSSNASQPGIVGNGRVIWAIIIAILAVTICAYWVENLSLAWSSSRKYLACVLIFMAVSYWYRRFRSDRWITFATESFAQLTLVLWLGCALSYPLAKLGFAYRDAALNAADIWMGLDWRAYLHFFNDSPLLSALTWLAYRSVLLQLVVLVLVLVSTSRFLRVQQYILASAFALAITLAVFAIVPAGGIYSFLNIQPWEFSHLSPIMTTDQLLRLDALRSGQDTLVNGLEGLITFPSFHAVWAVSLIWGFYPIKQLRFGAILLDLFVIASTPVQGAHYFIDVIGGVIVAIVAIWGAVRLTHSVRYRNGGR